MIHVAGSVLTNPANIYSLRPMSALNFRGFYSGYFFLMAFLSGLQAHAQTNVQEKEAMEPFWNSGKMVNESVLMISSNGHAPEARLLFKPKKIISVTNSALDTAYVEGVDWEYKNGKLILFSGSKAKYMTDKQLYPDSARFPKIDGGYIFHTEGTFFHRHQLAVTYTHKKKAWKGLIPKYQGNQLQNSINSLRNKKKLHLLLFGDSISSGANASGVGKAAPYLPAFGELVANQLQDFYQSEIKFTNTAVGGKTSQWGVETAKERVADHHPDLVIIAFGMNDGTGKMSPAKFKENIALIMTQTKAVNPDVEFILVAPMLPNPESKFLGTQPLFKKVLDELSGPGVIVTDITAVHRELLKHKSYQDMTGNNINHPNDFLMRWYAQQIVGTLIPKK